ncbi:MAG: molybdenum cofactor guanylyltransferase [Leptolyngbya sp. PLA3]|nr:MAG: molybdenum cofactor guanylyltransferase [Cyanobacteria bacterium CYA]MCE7969959.1 molybdenum cofactor guanylyltransferase [Leptolyngbya sp. PL-A3]
MIGGAPPISQAFLDSIQPVVLVGGKSRRFGRDKLVEPWNGKYLVQYPIEALRRIFGARVKTVGACDPRISGLADGAVSDHHPGVGPIGGIVSALDSWNGPVFVLAGDMPSVSGVDILAIVAEAERKRDLAAVVGITDRIHPCFGTYFEKAGPLLQGRIATSRYRLHDALPMDLVRHVAVSRESAANINAR